MNADKRRCFLLVLLALCANPRTAAVSYATDIRGVSLAHVHRGERGYGSEDCRKQLQAIRDLGANWIAISDFAYMNVVDEPHIRVGGDRTMRRRQIVRCIEDAHELGLKVLVKPHIWSRQFYNSDKWQGDIKMTSEADWDEWFKQYGEYVLHHARIAQETGAAMLCIGVEYQATSAAQEARWRNLIADLRKIYTGPITYAAAFEEWPNIQWWDAVDYIGIDAYFPVASQANATEEEIRLGWARVYAQLEPLSRKWNKPILFTELGYSASVEAAIRPWAWDVVSSDPNYQARIYRIAVEEASKREFVMGVFIWKWFTSDMFRRFEGRDPFAMQDREEVLEVLREAWNGEKPGQ